MMTPSGATSAAARNRPELNEARRKLPLRPRMVLVTGFALLSGNDTYATGKGLHRRGADSTPAFRGARVKALSRAQPQAAGCRARGLGPPVAQSSSSAVWTTGTP